MRWGTIGMGGAWVLIGGPMRWGTNEMGDQWDGGPLGLAENGWTNEKGDQWEGGPMSSNNVVGDLWIGAPMRRGPMRWGTNEMGDQWVGGTNEMGTNEMSGAWVLIVGSMRWGTNEMGDQWDGEPMRWGTNEMGDQWCAPDLFSTNKSAHKIVRRCYLCQCSRSVFHRCVDRPQLVYHSCGFSGMLMYVIIHVISYIIGPRYNGTWLAVYWFWLLFQNLTWKPFTFCTETLV